METAVSEVRARAVASLERASMTRATMRAMVRSRCRLGARAMREWRPSRRRVPRTAATCPVGEAAAAGEGFVGGDEGFAFEDAAECFDGVIGEFGEVGEGSLFYLGSVAEGLPEEDGGGRVPVGHAFHIHDY